MTNKLDQLQLRLINFQNSVDQRFNQVTAQLQKTADEQVNDAANFSQSISTLTEKLDEYTTSNKMAEVMLTSFGTKLQETVEEFKKMGMGAFVPMLPVSLRTSSLPILVANVRRSP